LKTQRNGISVYTFGFEHGELWSDSVARAIKPSQDSPWQKKRVFLGSRCTDCEHPDSSEIVRCRLPRWAEEALREHQRRPRTPAQVWAATDESDWRAGRLSIRTGGGRIAARYRTEFVIGPSVVADHNT
jgi:hypothetical protein